MNRNSYIKAFCILFFLTISFVIVAQTSFPKVVRDGREYIQYKVSKGEGMYAICKKFNVKYEDVATINPEIRNGLKVGQQLLIPIQQENGTKSSIPPVGQYEQSDFFYHTVEQGETLYSIARSYGVEVSALTKLNPGSAEGIKIGLMLKVPQVSQLPSSSLVNKSDLYRFHTISPKETPYSVSRKYGISIQRLLDENPALTTETFSIGRVIRIPYGDMPDAKVIEEPAAPVQVKKDSIYIVKRRETLFALSKRFNVSMSELLRINPALRDGIKEGMSVRIPVTVTVKTVEDKVENAVAQEFSPDLSEIIREATKAKPQNQIRVALLLPFYANRPIQSDSSYRFIEYYEGFLLAVEQLKSEGVSVSLNVYDTGNGLSEINKILNQSDFQSVDIIIGPVFNDQIALIADYSRRNKKLMVIPFTSRNDDILTNPYLFQINTPQSYLFSEVAQSFCKRYKDHNVLFLDNPQIKSDKEEFLTSVKSEMNRVGLTFKTYSTSVDTLPNLKDYIVPGEKNVIIPTSGSAQFLEYFMPTLRLTAELQPEYDIALFGYPEWQTYTKDFIEAFYLLNTTIYSSFFIDNKDADFKQFYRRFVTSYSKDLRNTFPKYGVLGYDSGIYFLRGLRKWGANFELNAEKFPYTGIQTGFTFERLNSFGGYINKKAYFVHFMKDFRIEKIEIKKQ